MKRFITSITVMSLLFLFTSPIVAQVLQDPVLQMKLNESIERRKNMTPQERAAEERMLQQMKLQKLTPKQMMEMKQREATMKSLQDQLGKTEADMNRSRADTAIKVNKGMQQMLITPK